MGNQPSLTPTPLPSDKTPRCEKCNAKVDPKQGWCGRCGWYPRLEIFLELDPWDRDPSPSEEAEEKKVDKLEPWRKLIPVWGWKMIGGVVGLLILTLLARFLLPAHGNYRFVWTVGQMAIGGLVLFGRASQLLYLRVLGKRPANAARYHRSAIHHLDYRRQLVADHVLACIAGRVGTRGVPVFAASGWLQQIAI